MGHLVFTVEPSGIVSRVVLEPPFARTPTGACIARVVSEIRVRPFRGGAMNVGKGFPLPTPPSPVFDRQADDIAHMAAHRDCGAVTY